jgi:5-methylcytosine-specific restriction endonuclease McrA
LRASAQRQTLFDFRVPQRGLKGNFDKENMDELNFDKCSISLKKSFKSMVKKLIYVLELEKHCDELDSLQKEANIKRGQLLYCFEYMKKKSNMYINIGEMLLYCDKRRNEDTNGKQKNFRDNSRAFEIFRKDRYPLVWKEFTYNRNKYILYSPKQKEDITSEIIENSNSKKDKFTKNIIEEKLKVYNYACAITGIPQSDGGLAADHFVPKEKGGKSTNDNCIILNKLLNEKKNNEMPIPWFCKTLLTNFMDICKSVGINPKKQLIEFIENYN